mmetsp:Transcript_68333/g.204780  ORF Transcript_68333/g.204780 Transcript_68333/m.204780 type:complete len:201 (-) Transcript_68333:403-1005(-)
MSPARQKQASTVYSILPSAFSFPRRRGSRLCRRCIVRAGCSSSPSTRHTWWSSGQKMTSAGITRASASFGTRSPTCPCSPSVQHPHRRCGRVFGRRCVSRHMRSLQRALSTARTLCSRSRSRPRQARRAAHWWRSCSRWSMSWPQKHSHRQVQSPRSSTRIASHQWIRSAPRLRRCSALHSTACRPRKPFAWEATMAASW